MFDGYGFLIDMDGVIYSGGKLIPGATEFIGELLESNRPFMFLTNNSQRTRRDIMTRLNRLSIAVNENHIIITIFKTTVFFKISIELLVYNLPTLIIDKKFRTVISGQMSEGICIYKYNILQIYTSIIGRSISLGLRVMIFYEKAQ